jgi:hypothetical protein
LVLYDRMDLIALIFKKLIEMHEKAEKYPKAMGQS